MAHQKTDFAAVYVPVCVRECDIVLGEYGHT